MSKAVYGLLAAAGSITAAVVGINGWSGEKVRENTFIGPVAIGGLTPLQARARMADWWTRESHRDLRFTGGRGVVTDSLSSLNVQFDIDRTLDAAPRAKLWGDDPKPVRLAPIFRFDEGKLEKLKARLEQSVPVAFRPAQVTFEKDTIKRVPEEPHLALDLAGVPHAIETQLGSLAPIALPTVAEEKHVSDEALSDIREVVSSYSTRFSTAKTSRCSNIKLAASKLNGRVLLPGERISFNDTVGRRTQKNGFKIAGVYKNGKHDFDVGGGICQVSTTLYNAALLSNLKVVSRHNHSMPVAYVPLGRDATVDYGVLDLVIENDTEKAIAITSEYHPGLLRFRILGTKQPGLTVKIQTEGRKNWDAGVQTVVDNTLPAGAKKVLEKGTQGHSISTYRLVFQDGKLVTKQVLGQSYYKGGQRIIAVGKSASPPVTPQA